MPEHTPVPMPYGRTGWVAVFTDGRRINVECWHHGHGAALLVDATGGRLVQAVSVPGFFRLDRTAPTEMSL
jgi:hypothetical protein